MFFSVTHKGFEQVCLHFIHSLNVYMKSAKQDVYNFDNLNTDY